MRHVIIASALALAFSASGCKSGSSSASTPAKVGPLAPIVDIAAALEKGINDFASGKTPAEKAFAGFAATARKGSLDNIKEAKAKQIIFIGMEFELMFYKGGKGAYYLRTMVHPGAKGPAFLNFAGRVVTDGKFYVKGKPLAAYTGAAAGLGTAAKDFLASLNAGKCDVVPVADPAPLKKLLPKGSRMTDRMLKGLERSQQNLKTHCEAAKAIGADNVELRIDDIAFATVGDDGKINGMIRADFEFKDGKVAIEIGAHRPMK